ncbi:MAG TPA: hypothetical protein VF746_15410 [Longimicrobium sp.]
MMRFVLAVLVLASAGCATTAWEWVEPVAVEMAPGVKNDRLFIPRWDWKGENCSMSGGSHVTLKRGGRVVTMLTLSNPHRDARLRYGVTFLAADGSPLGHLPYPGGGVYVAKLRARYPNVILASDVAVSPEVFERAARVLLHVSC